MALADSLTLSGYVPQSMAAELHFDPRVLFLRVWNTGNESFRVEVRALEAAIQTRGLAHLSEQAQEQNLPAQLGVYLSSTVPAHKQGELDLRSSIDPSHKNTFNVSILAP